MNTYLYDGLIIARKVNDFMITHQLKLATEPTGSLDEIITADIIDTLRQVAHENDKCVIVVTHSKQLAKEADVVLALKDKKLKEQESQEKIELFSKYLC